MDAAELVQLPDQARSVGRPRVLLGGFPGRGFPARDGLDQALEILKSLDIPTLHVAISDEKLDEVVSFKPNVAIFYRTKMSLIERDLRCLRALQKRGCRRALWCCDLKSADSLARPVAGLFEDIFLPWRGSFNDPSYRRGDCSVEAWQRESGARCWYMPQGSALRRPVESKIERRVLFVGDTEVRVHHGRGAVCASLGAEVVNAPARADRLRIEQRCPEMYRSSRYVLSLSPPAPGYTSIRTYNILCWGGLALLQRYPKCEKLFRHGEHLLVFKSVLEGKRVTSRYDKRPAACETIRSMGWSLAARKHTMTHRLLNIIANTLDVDDRFWGYLE